MPYYKKCSSCGANNDPGERCSCKGAGTVHQPPSSAARKIQTIAHNEAYKETYDNTYLDMLHNNNLPACIADDIASGASHKRARSIAKATAKSYEIIKGRAI